MENVKYQIGELASILNISRQMIRYYEDCGVISPERIAGNNYRLYSAMDYFALAEAISLSRFDINIKDIYSLKMTDYARQIKKRYEEFIEKTEEQIGYEELMIERAREMIEKNETAALNIGNVWVRKVPAHVLYPLMKSKDDVYGEIITPKKIRSLINQGKNVVFGDGLIEFGEGEERWSILFDEKYLKIMDLPECDEKHYVPDQYCLCTVMDMGEIGSFRADDVRAFRKVAEKSHYRCSESLCGLLLARGSEDGVFHRYLEVRIPLETLQ